MSASVDRCSLRIGRKGRDGKPGRQASRVVVFLLPVALAIACLIGPVATAAASAAQQAELFAPNAATNEEFGNSVAVSSDTAVVGAWGDYQSMGSAWGFLRTGSSWATQAKFIGPDGSVGDYFGQAVAVDGDTAVFGAPNKTVNGKSSAGAAYVYVRSSGTWSMQAELTAGDAAASDHFGWSVSVSGDTAVIGAVGKNDGTGAAYVFVRSGTTWSQQAKLTAGDAAAGDSFGWSVAFSAYDGMAVIGASGKNTGTGAAYVFARSGTAWAQQIKLTASDGTALDHFGCAVALEAYSETVVVGADGAAVAGKSNAGAAYVFVPLGGGGWGQVSRLTGGAGLAGEQFGTSVAISGSILIVGAPHRTAATSGSAYVFTSFSGSWQVNQKLTAGDASAGDDYGASVAVDGWTAVVGAPGKSTGAGLYAGAAYVYMLDATPPVTAASLSSSQAANAAGWFHTSPVTVTLTATDDVSMYGTWYRFHGIGPWTYYSGPFTVSAEGSTTYDYYSEDLASNVEAVKTVTVKLDTTAPTTTATLSSSQPPGNATGWFHTSPVTVTLTPGDGSGSGVPAGNTWYRVQGASSWTQYAAPFSVGTPGSTTYEFYSTDAAGNQETSPKTVTVKIDTTVPATTAGLSPSADAAGWNNTAVQVTLTRSDGGGSGVAATYYTIDGVSQPLYLYATPFTYSTPGTHTISYWSTDNAGNVETPGTLTVRIDTTAPTTSAGLSSSQPANAAGWFHTSPVTVTLTPSDGSGSGVPAGNTWYRVQGASSWTPYTAPFSVATPGSTTYEFYSTAAAGNQETSPKTVTVKLDTTAPTTSAGLSSSQPVNATGWFHASPVTVTLTPGDGSGSGVPAGNTWYRVQGVSGWTQYVTPFTVSTPGSTTYELYSQDAAGNNETPKTVAVKLDLTPPTSSATLDPLPNAAGWNKSTVGVTLATDDGSGSGVPLGNTWYHIQGASGWTPFTSAFTISTPGSTTYEFYSTDAVGNQESPAKTVTVKIDTVAPVTTADGLQSSASSTWQKTPQDVTLHPADTGGSGLASTYYTVDGTQKPYSGTFTISASGSHAVTYWSTDNAGNLEAFHTGHVNIDTVAPTTAAALTPAANGAGWNSGPVTLSLHGDDPNGCGVMSTEYRLVGASTWTPYTLPILITGDGVTSYEFRSTDNAANAETPRTVTIKIDGTAPVTTIPTTLPTGWSNKPVTVTLVGDDAGSGRAATQYRLQGASAWTPYTVPFQVTTQGSSTWEYRSLDAAGNAETPKTFSLQIDSQAPSASAYAAKVKHNKSVALAYQVVDPTPGCGSATVTLKIFKGSKLKKTLPALSCATNVTASYKWRCSLPAGSYTIEVFATDAAGNVQAKVGTAKLMVK